MAINQTTAIVVGILVAVIIVAVLYMYTQNRLETYGDYLTGFRPHPHPIMNWNDEPVQKPSQWKPHTDSQIHFGTQGNYLLHIPPNANLLQSAQSGVFY